MYPFWQVQDKVPAFVIKSFTKSCERKDCTISFRMGETTCAATSDSYDRDGMLMVADHNRYTGKISCKMCWRGAVIDESGNMSEEFEGKR